MEMSLIGFLSFLIIIISVVNCHFKESMKKGERLKYPPFYVVYVKKHICMRSVTVRAWHPPVVYDDNNKIIICPDGHLPFVAYLGSNANLANLELNDDATENFLRVNEGSNGKSFAALCLGAHLLEKWWWHLAYS